ncbi:hypothetical protein V6N12_071680 [Hibiscus sabdariffa]|uniref:Uncharacterized protein n=1 Tax=Hibiscus sabdariffa TaxID=183260 RepID=A0ABR2FKI0_9ROSI
MLSSPGINYTWYFLVSIIYDIWLCSGSSILRSLKDLYLLEKFVLLRYLATGFLNLSALGSISRCRRPCHHHLLISGRRSRVPSSKISRSPLRRRFPSSPFNPSVGFGSEADMLPFSAQFDRARTSELARNHSAGPRTSDPGKRTFQ